MRINCTSFRQELPDDDPNGRIQFCESMTQKIVVELKLVKNIYFSGLELMLLK